MPATVLRSALVTDCRQRANMESSQFCTDVEIQRYIDQACKDLYDKLIDARGENYYMLTAPLTTTASVSYLPLPAAFYNLLFVRMQVQGSWVTLDTFDRIDLDAMKNATGSAPSFPIRYRLETDQPSAANGFLGLANLVLMPAPAAVYSVEVDYIPSYAGNLNAGDVALDGINGWEEYVIWKVVATMLAKQDADNSNALRMMGLESVRIEKLRDRRNAGRPARVIDTRRDFLGTGQMRPWWW